MFDVGEFAVCGHNGVCRVEDITTLNMSGIDKTRKYYILRPVSVNTSVVYVPLDVAETSLRGVMPREEAQKLVATAGQAEFLDKIDDRMLEKQYKECIKSNQCTEWMRLLKTVYNRRQERLQSGRKVTAVDDKYFRIAADNLFAELAIALDLPVGEIEQTILGQLEENRMQKN